MEAGFVVLVFPYESFLQVSLFKFCFCQVEVAEAVFVEVRHHIVCNLLELAFLIFLLVETYQTLDSLLSDILEGI